MNMLQSQEAARAVPRPLILVLTGLALVLAALVFRVQALDRIAFFDEYYHLLAARGWLETGRPTILDGEYTRTRLFTGAVAWLFRLTGSDTLATGRLLSVAGGVLLPPVVFLWVRSWAGWGAALIAAGLTVLWPEGIEEAQRLRFYTWHVLFTTIGAIAVFQAFEGRRELRLGWGIVAVLALVAALYLQINTAFAILAILLWIGLAHVLPWMLAQKRRWLLIGLSLAAGLLVIAAAWATGVLDALWAQYRWVPGWTARRVDNAGYYHGLLREDYPTFWPLLPFAALLALRMYPRPAFYALLLFGVGFVGLSFGGMKAVRYLSYGMPFFFILVALAITGLAGLLRAPILAATRPIDPTRGGWLGVAVVTGAVLFACASNPFVDRSIDALRGRPFQRFPLYDWSHLPELVGDWAEAPYVITTIELPTIAYLGDYDVLYNQSRMSELPPHAEFVVDPRTGRPVIDEPATVATILACQPEGLLLTESGQWEWQGWKAALMPVFAASGDRIEIRDHGGLLALHWSGGTASPEACAALPHQAD